MRPNHSPLVLFSVKQADLTDSENHSNHEMVHRVLSSLGYKFSPAVGVTERWGKERSFLVVLPPRSNPEFNARLDKLLSIARVHNQDAILYVHEDRFTELKPVGFIGGILPESSPLGYIQRVPKRFAELLGNYTMLGEDAYYACLTTPNSADSVNV